LDVIRPLDVVIAHGMCTTNETWAEGSLKALLKAMGGDANAVRLQPNPIEAHGIAEGQTTLLGLPAIASVIVTSHAAAPEFGASNHPDGVVAGMSLIARDIDRAVSAKSGNKPAAYVKPQSAVKHKKAISVSVKDPYFPLELIHHINQVGVGVEVQRLSI